MQYAQEAGYFSIVSSQNQTIRLPDYDKDSPEIISAMQKQDRMILDVKQQREIRGRQGENAVPLKPIVCGSDCFSRKGVWCCRRDW
jgi:hypothetical protein